MVSETLKQEEAEENLRLYIQLKRLVKDRIQGFVETIALTRLDGLMLRKDAQHHIWIRQSCTETHTFISDGADLRYLAREKIHASADLYSFVFDNKFQNTHTHTHTPLSSIAGKFIASCTL